MKRRNYPQGLEQFWDAWRQHKLMRPQHKKPELLKAWVEMEVTDDDVPALIETLPHYAATQKVKEGFIVHPCRYLTEERFEHFPPFTEEQKQIWVEPGTPQYEAWARYLGWKANLGPRQVESEWPPIREVSSGSVG